MARFSARLQGLPDELRQGIKARRKGLGWSQHALAQHAGLAQRHISGIETGKIVPRHDTLLEILRVLGLDLCVVPRALVPVVQALVRDYERRSGAGVAAQAGRQTDERRDEPQDERPLYAVDD